MKPAPLPHHLLFVIFLFLFASCAPSRFVKPLAAKEQAVNISLGGPLIEYGDATIPMPMITATYGYGIDSTLTGFASVNLTSALLGNAQIELGLNKQVFKQKKILPGLSVNPVANLIYRNKDAFKFYPALDVNAFWNHSKNKYLFYVGLSNWFELSSKKAFGQKQDPHWVLSPMIGEYLNYKKWSFNLELKTLAVNLESDKTVTGYKTPFNHHGAFGIYAGITKKLK